MNKRFAFVLILVTALPFACFSQSRKDIKKMQLQSKSVYEYFIEEGIKDPVLETYEVYDTTGNVIELKELNSEGLVKTWQKFAYDSKRNKIEELTLDQKGKIVEKVVWVYKDDLVVEKKYFDGKDRLVKRKEYKYKYYSN
jgi:competence protein ComGC